MMELPTSVPVYTSVPVHNPTSGESPLPPPGSQKWKNSVFNCLNHCKPGDYCVTLWCCVWLPIAHLANDTQAFKRFMNSRGVIAAFIMMLLILMDIRYVQDMGARVHVQAEDIDGDGVTDGEYGYEAPSSSFPLWLYFFFFIFVWKLRSTVRQQLGINGSDCEDGCLSCCCSWCVISQMMHQLYKDPEQSPGGILMEIRRVEPVVESELRGASWGGYNDDMTTSLLSGPQTV